MRTDSILAAQPEPGTARQPSGDWPAVWAVGLAKSYGSTVALTGLDLHVATGETVALLGPNGAGRKIADGPPAAIKANFGDQQVRFTLVQGSSAPIAAIDGVRAVENDGDRVTVHSSDTDATVRSLVSNGLAWSGLEVGGLDLETSFLRLLGEQP